ncbi:hypothetical protein L873DRAFT_1796598 [Choiromyces venosus 120613-1]|uniref:Uncharacterized protein n=1 Tax=Choiromyces venosus 120613-1 TaxID=1336337 RepID=A0A3N4IUV4_9PEZI|nr:hypothetical protein L873DRAFT_1796598 [Choiromyces venosus 120613-1]
MDLIADHFIKNNTFIDNFNRNDKGYIFQFKKTPIINKFILAKEDEELKIKFNTLIKIINDSINDKMESEKSKLAKFISELKFESSIFDKLGFENKETLSWNGDSLVQEEVETIFLSNQQNDELSNSENFKISKRSSFQALNTTFTIHLKSKNYLLCHYNAADLSMLQD